MNIDINKLETLRSAYLSVGDMVNLTANAYLDDIDGEELNLCYFACLLRLLNAEFDRIIWGNFNPLKQHFPPPQNRRAGKNRPKPPAKGGHNNFRA